MIFFLYSRYRKMLIRQNDYIEQIKSSKRRKKEETSTFHRPFAPPFVPGDLRRIVFCSLSLLNRQYKTLPRLVLDTAILCLDADRSWVFHQFSEGRGSDKQIAFFKTRFDSRYMDFSTEFVDYLKTKEASDLVYWHRPKKDYVEMSKFFERIQDTVQKDTLNPLILEPEVWEEFGEEKGWSNGSVWHPPRKSLSASGDDGGRGGGPGAEVASSMSKTTTTKTRTLRTKPQTSKPLAKNARRPRFTASVRKVVSNFQSGSAELSSLKELIFQSNPTLSFYVEE